MATDVFTDEPGLGVHELPDKLILRKNPRKPF